jgi:hypothetical protein
MLWHGVVVSQVSVCKENDYRQDQIGFSVHAASSPADAEGSVPVVKVAEVRSPSPRLLPTSDFTEHSPVKLIVGRLVDTLLDFYGIRYHNCLSQMKPIHMYTIFLCDRF